MLNFEKIIEVAEGLEWNVSVSDTLYTFENYTSMGQNLVFENDFNTPEELIKSLGCFSSNFDVSQEANYWIDSSGHGTNGAPYELKDIIEDMEEAKQMYDELYLAIKKVEN